MLETDRTKKIFRQACALPDPMAAIFLVQLRTTQLPAQVMCGALERQIVYGTLLSVTWAQVWIWFIKVM